MKKTETTLAEHIRSGPPTLGLRVSAVKSGASASSRGECITVGTAADGALVLEDARVSRYHLEIARAGDRIAIRDLGSTNGTSIGPIRLMDASVTVPSGTSVRIGRTDLIVSDGELSAGRSYPEAPTGVLGTSAVMGRVFAKLEQLAESAVPVLFVGESGVGKEVMARAMHTKSARAAEPFIVLDCGATSPHLFESALFGHERGAFTGAAARRRGAFELAQGGTLMLDEVGELPVEEQVALLGVLERRAYRRVGGDQELEVRCRVVSATNRDLRADVNRGAFRLDLYYRLAVVSVVVPPLREHREDIAELLGRFLVEEGYAGELDRLFDAAALAELQAHSWPGNVRELKNLALSTLALGQRPPLERPGLLPSMPERSTGLSDSGPLPSYREARAEVTTEFERAYLTTLLERTDGNVRRAAREARMNRSYLIELLQRHGLR